MIKIKTISMGNMRPLQVGVIVDGDYKGRYVLRTASKRHFEVMDLSVPKVSGCWTDENYDLQVRLLDPNEEVILTLNNRE